MSVIKKEVFIHQRLCDLVDGTHRRVADKLELPFVMPMVSPSLDFEAAEFGIAGQRDRAGRDVFRCGKHSRSVFHLRKHPGQSLRGGETLRDSAGRYDDNLAVGDERHGLFCRKDDVFVVPSSTKTVFAGVARTASTMSSRAGIHRLAAADNLCTAEFFKECTQTVACRYGNKAEFLFGALRVLPFLFAGLRRFVSRAICVIEFGSFLCLLFHVFDFTVSRNRIPALF